MKDKMKSGEIKYAPALVCVYWLALVTITSCSLQKNIDVPYDTAPIDWKRYQPLYIKGLSRATAQEPIRSSVDLRSGVQFLDDASLQWTRQNKCATCHTNVSYLIARPLLEPSSGDPTQEIRATLKIFAANQQANPTPLSSFFLAPIVAALAINDAELGRSVDPSVRDIFRFLWKIQESDGSWRYPTDGLVPFLERNNYYVSLLVALAVGYSSAEVYDDSASQAGFSKLQNFLRDNIPSNLHDRTVLLWASVRTPALLTSVQKLAIQHELLNLQNADGGWTLSAMGRWPRHDGRPNTALDPSDAYATGLATMVLCESGVESNEPSVERATKWFGGHQRQSGRWFTPSLYSGRFQNYLSNMATAYAMMALAECTHPAFKARERRP